MGLIISDDKKGNQILQSMYVQRMASRACSRRLIQLIVIGPCFLFHIYLEMSRWEGFAVVLAGMIFFLHIFVKTIGYQFYCTSLSNTPFKIINKGSEVLRVRILSQLNFSNFFKQQKRVSGVFRTAWAIKHLKLKTVFVGPVLHSQSNDKVL